MSSKKRSFPLLFLLTATIIVAVFTHFYILLITPVSLADKTRIVEIKQGLGIRQISNFLAQEGLIPSAKLFTLLTVYKGGGIKAGEYQLNDALSSVQLLAVLQEGKVYLHKVTIPEGYNLRQIARLLEEQKLASAQEIISIANNPMAARNLLGTDLASLEGYLFPETYYFARNTSAETIVSTMVEHFNQLFNETFQEKAQALGFDRHQIVTLASLIEKETADETERPLISAVYHNRLKEGIKLQCDPTVIYALEQAGQFDGNIHKEDLEIDSPYNSYLYEGLPPGPIANPGQASIWAALNPAENNFKYFVSRNDGTHEFSENLEEHNKAVYKYQILPNKQGELNWKN